MNPQRRHDPLERSDSSASAIDATSSESTKTPAIIEAAPHVQAVSSDRSGRDPRMPAPMVTSNDAELNPTIQIPAAYRETLAR